jgi:hypothetical protein
METVEFVRVAHDENVAHATLFVEGEGHSRSDPVALDQLKPSSGIDLGVEEHKL